MPASKLPAQRKPARPSASYSPSASDSPRSPRKPDCREPRPGEPEDRPSHGVGCGVWGTAELLTEPRWSGCPLPLCSAWIVRDGEMGDLTTLTHPCAGFLITPQLLTPLARTQ